MPNIDGENGQPEVDMFNQVYQKAVIRYSRSASIFDEEMCDEGCCGCDLCCCNCGSFCSNMCTLLFKSLIHIFIAVFVISFLGMAYTIYDTENLDGLPTEHIEDIEKAIRMEEMYIRHSPMMVGLHSNRRSKIQN